MEGALFYSARQGYVYREPGKHPLRITARPTPNAASARLKSRKNIDSRTGELADLRRTVKLPLSDKRGFDYYFAAGMVRLGWCQYHDRHFLPRAPSWLELGRLVHGRRGRRAPVLPARVHANQP
jgi:hypothetical protein